MTIDSILHMPMLYVKQITTVEVMTLKQTRDSTLAVSDVSIKFAKGPAAATLLYEASAGLYLQCADPQLLTKL